MSRLACLSTSTALALCAGAAFAEITADDAWAAIEAQYAAMGVTISSNLTREGNTLTVDGIVGRLVLPAGLGTLDVATGNVVMTENDDGSVNAEMGPVYAILAEFDLNIDAEPVYFGLSLEVETQDYSALITGMPGNIAIDTSVGLVEVTLVEVTLPPDLQSEADDFDMDFYVMTEGLASRALIRTDNAVLVQFEGSVDRTVTDVSFMAGGFVSNSVSLTEDTTYSGMIQFPAVPIDLANLAAALRAGLALDLATTSGTTTSQSVTRSDGLVLSDQGQTLASLGQTLALNAAGLDASTGIAGLDLTYKVVDLTPAPLRATLADASISFSMPLLASPGATPAAFSLRLGDLQVDDTVLDLIGPGAAAMNSPFDLTLVMSALMRWRVDVLDFESLVEAFDGGRILAELPSVAVDGISASFGGATLTGTGAMTFDWAGVEQLYQLVEPTGQAGYVITGANILLDRLAGTGLVGLQEMMGLRGALALAGRPTGPDELTGAVEFGPDGGLRLNGVVID